MRFLLYMCFAFQFIACKNEQNKEQIHSESEKLDKSADSHTQNQKNQPKTIIFFGNSLTAGYGLDEEFSFPSLIQKKIDSLKLNYKAVNAGLSGETSADGFKRVDWILKQKPDIFVLELGANDVLRGQNLFNTNQNLRFILNKVMVKNPEVKLVIAGMLAPPNMGKQYTTDFKNIFIGLSKDYKASFIPFLLEGVAGIPKLNLSDGKHPNAEGQKIVAENVWKIIKGLL
ncbi:MAG: hypothetical protein RLZZ546_601 [Bacteroidota bacterium]